MAGRQDTPEDRQARQDAGTGAPDGLDEEPRERAPARARAARGRGVRASRRAGNGRDAVVDDGDLMVADRPQARNPYGRRDGIPNSLVASAARIPLNDRRAIENTRRRRQAWQSEAWDYFDEIGEIGYTNTFLANLMSKLVLYPAVRLDPKESPVSVDDKRSGVDPATARLAIETLSRLQSQEGGQSAILRELSLNLEVAGECYLHGHVEEVGEPDPNEPVDLTPPTEQTGQPGGPNPNDVEDWQIRSVDELVIVGDRFSLRRGPGVKMLDPIPDNDLVIRIWERHPRFSEMATCAMRRVLAEAEALLLLSREVRATSKSRLSNGILLIPSELSFGPIDPTRDSGDGEETDDPFDAELQEAMITPIQEEGSASAVVPLTLRGPAEFLQHVNHLALDKNLDPVLDARIEQRIMRIARGLNMPVEVTTGLMSTTFANAVQVKRSEFDDHIEPRATLVCDAITSGYFQWALEMAGVEPDTARKIFVWFDAAALIEMPDPAEQAQEAHKSMLISDQAFRRYLGYSEDDKPTDEERLLRIVLNSPRLDPSILGQILKESGLFPDIQIPAPAAGVLGDTDPVSSMPATPAPPTPPTPPPVAGPPPPRELPPGARPDKAEADKAEADKSPSPAEQSAPTGPVAAAATPEGWRQLGRTLMALDRNLRARMTAKLDEAMRTTMERAGSRVRTRLNRDKGALRPVANGTPSDRLASVLGRSVVEGVGLSEEDLLDGSFAAAVGDVMAWMTATYRSALAAIEKATGPLPGPARIAVDQRFQADLVKAEDWLTTNLRALAGQRVYNPQPQVAPGENDGTVSIPASLVRAAVAVAGGTMPRGGTITDEEGSVVGASWVSMAGGPVTGPGGDPVGGIATGPTVMDAVDDQGGAVEGYQWDYGEGLRSEFVPHLDLDEQTAAEPSEFEWPASYDGYPSNDFPFPGDHDGCLCDLTPILISSEGQVTPDVAGEWVSPVGDTLGDQGAWSDAESATDPADLAGQFSAAAQVQRDALGADSAEQRALDAYLASDGQDVNAALRSGDITPAVAEDVASMDNAFDEGASILEGLVTLYRGLDALHELWEEGTVLTEDGYTAATAVPPGPEVQLGSTVLQIRAPTGARYLVGKSHDAEVLLERATTFRVAGITEVPVDPDDPAAGTYRVVTVDVI